MKSVLVTGSSGLIGSEDVAYFDRQAVAMPLRRIAVELVEATVEHRFTQAKPKPMIGDRAYDGDPLDQRLREKHGVLLIAPHKSNRRRKNTQDGRELRRYCRRWKIERSSLGFTTSADWSAAGDIQETNFLGVAKLDCFVILAERCMRPAFSNWALVVARMSSCGLLLPARRCADLTRTPTWVTPMRPSLSLRL